MIWLTYLRKRIVGADHLNTLSDTDLDEEFDEAFSQSIRKLLGAGGGVGTAATARRYLSKNNANIYRIGAINALCPEAVILVPFHDPQAHAGSLMTQYRRFLKIHGESRFSRRYMQWIGYFEFGANLKPIDLDGWLRDNSTAVADAPGILVNLLDDGVFPCVGVRARKKAVSNPFRKAPETGRGDACGDGRKGRFT